MEISRRNLKQNARVVLKRHYLLFVILCLIAALLGLEFAGSLTAFGLQTGNAAGGVVETGSTSAVGFGAVWDLLSEDQAQAAQDAVQRYFNTLRHAGTESVAGLELGRSRGIFASAVNAMSSGSVLVRIYTAIRGAVNSDSLATALFVILSLLAYLAIQSAVVSVYLVIYRRMALEARTYEKIQLRKGLFLLRQGTWLRTARTLLLTGLLQFAWNLTVVGGVIKYYSYRMVPYILAENSSIGSREAVTLSRRMMAGHKWECFKLDVSFLLWRLLSVVTAGLAGVFFVNPYLTATLTEYYAALRAQALEKKLPGAEKLCDTWLYEKPDQALVDAAYAKLPHQPMEVPKLTGVEGFFANNFGIIFRLGLHEKAYRKATEENQRYERWKLHHEGKIYPSKLSPVKKRSAKIPKLPELYPMRHYPIWSLVLIFFVSSMFGWCWEVMLFLIERGKFVNRGVLLGPWLPIYGSGVVMILVLLFRARKKPALEFGLTILLCGFVEYFTSLVLELRTGGMKWWDYSGYFLNLHGRICAEGLLVFGIGGMAAVYLLSPLLDSFFRRFKTRYLVSAAAVLLLLFGADQVYSAGHPNVGEGITDNDQQINVTQPEEPAGKVG